MEEVGAAVTRVKPGRRVAIEPAMPCHKCDQCLAGRQNTCRKLRFLGCPGQAEGCLSEYLVMPEESCFPIADSVSLDEAALSEPLAIGVYAVKQSVPMSGAKIGILGSGPIGLSVLMPALAGGAAGIYVTDKIDARLDVARGAGATWTGNPKSVDVVNAISSAEPDLLDAVFECAGDQDTVDQALKLLRPGGKLMLIGIPPTLEKYGFYVDLMRRKEICVQNVRRQNHCLQPSLDMIRDPRLRRERHADPPLQIRGHAAGVRDGRGLQRRRGQGHDRHGLMLLPPLRSGRMFSMAALPCHMYFQPR